MNEMITGYDNIRAALKEALGANAAHASGVLDERLGLAFAANAKSIKLPAEEIPALAARMRKSGSAVGAMSTFIHEVGKSYTQTMLVDGKFRTHTLGNYVIPKNRLEITLADALAGHKLPARRRALKHIAELETIGLNPAEIERLATDPMAFEHAAKRWSPEYMPKPAPAAQPMASAPHAGITSEIVVEEPPTAKAKPKATKPIADEPTAKTKEAPKPRKAAAPKPKAADVKPDIHPPHATPNRKTARLAGKEARSWYQWLSHDADGVFHAPRALAFGAGAAVIVGAVYALRHDQARGAPVSEPANAR